MGHVEHPMTAMLHLWTWRLPRAQSCDKMATKVQAMHPTCHPGEPRGCPTGGTASSTSDDNHKATVGRIGPCLVVHHAILRFRRWFSRSMNHDKDNLRPARWFSPVSPDNNLEIGRCRGRRPKHPGPVNWPTDWPKLWPISWPSGAMLSSVDLDSESKRPPPYTSGFLKTGLPAKAHADRNEA